MPPSARASGVSCSASASSASSLLRMLALLLLALCAAAASSNYYEVLEVAADADEAAIKKAYRRLSLKYHPGEVRA